MHLEHKVLGNRVKMPHMEIKKCVRCEKKYVSDLHQHPKLSVCSFECLKALDIKYPTFNFKMIPQFGQGKHHQQWIALGSKSKKKRPPPWLIAKR